MNDGAPFDLLQFSVRGGTVTSPSLPPQLSRLPAAPATTGDERPFRLGFAKGRWRINDRVYDMSATAVDVAGGARETWILRNYFTSAPHAMHLHGFQFHVLERETSPDEIAKLAVDAKGRLATDLGMKDTVLVWPGESVRIAIDFSLAASEPQIFLLHCHNLEHEDAGMMLRVKVG
jgi:suppressor of ftsI/bilirubin oxidase